MNDTFSNEELIRLSNGRGRVGLYFDRKFTSRLSCCKVAALAAFPEKRTVIDQRRRR